MSNPWPLIQANDSGDELRKTEPSLSDEDSRPSSRQASTSSHLRPLRSGTSTPGLSPLNPRNSTARSRPMSTNSAFIKRVASEESQTLGSPAHRGSMILYRLAADDNEELPEPPKLSDGKRDSTFSTSGESFLTLSYDSKYPSGATPTGQRGFIPYAYDPLAEAKDEPEDDDYLYEAQYGEDTTFCYALSWRGILNIAMLLVVILALLTLFICYPVLSFYRDDSLFEAIGTNSHINGSGQAVNAVARRSLLDAQAPLAVAARPRDLIDPDTPTSARTRAGFDGEPYELVFSDEFNHDGRTFFAGDDPYWEAVHLPDRTSDLAWYDPGQITTSGGALRIALQRAKDASRAHGRVFTSGMLQSWNKFCFSGGYVEIAVTLPGTAAKQHGYRPAAWTLGNLARAGYPATTDGTWPYSYDSCDVGTFPGPTAPTRDGAEERSSNPLSRLPGQRLSSCTCPGEDHPGPTPSQGRGAPEIDIMQAIGEGAVVAQSAHVAPPAKAADTDSEAWRIFNASGVRTHAYRGSSLHQTVSASTDIPADTFQHSGPVFTRFGVEYWADAARPEDGFVTWQANGEPSVRMGAAAIGPDQGVVSQRLVSEEPMSLIFNLGMSDEFQKADLSEAELPAEMLVDYVRVYQRAGQTNVGCSPPAYPTAEYISAHAEAYSNPELTSWSGPGPHSAGYSWPKNGLYDSHC